MKIDKWIKKHTHSLAGKTVAVSGATGGIGRALCEHLASLGADLILMDRNAERSRTLGERLCKKFEGIAVSYINVDLSDPESVKSATEKLKETKVEALILNAGAYHIPRHKTSLGLDNVFQINFVSPYYIIRSLLRKRGGGVVAVGSIAHRYSHVDPSDPDFSSRTKSSLVYGNAKRHLMYSLMALSAEEGGISIVHPGITFTNITAHYPKVIFAIIKNPMKVIFMKPARACLSILYGVFRHTGDSEWIGPSIFDIWGSPKVSRLGGCNEEERRVIEGFAETFYSKMKE